jgi:hypothetical protein
MFATRFLAVSIAFLSSADHSATASTVRDLAKYCSSSIDTSDYSYCLGVMAGAKDLATVATATELLRQSRQDPFPLPNDPQTGKPFTDPRLAIVAIDRDLSRLSSNPYAHEQVMALRDWRDRIGDSIKPRGFPPGTVALDICFSHPEPDLAELADVFVAWARAYPAAENWDEALGLVSAFRAKWPCESLAH